MPIIPLFGHEQLRARLSAAARRGSLPQSLLLHGPHGVGKQRLALWLGQLLLCANPGAEPCGECESCRYAVALAHPDLHWFFPRPRLKDADASPNDILEDLNEVIAERAEAGGVYAPPERSDRIFIATIHALVQQAAKTPALGKRKVFILGDAESTTRNEEIDQASGAFLKLLEEPPANTWLILTSGEPGALLPTIRSRVAAVRVAPMSDESVEKLFAEPRMAAALDKSSGIGARDRVRAAAGAPGALLAMSQQAAAMESARRLIEAAESGAGERAKAAFGAGVSKARGAFTDILDAMSSLLRDRALASIRRGDMHAANGASRAMAVVEAAKARAEANITPQLITASMLRELEPLLR